MCEPEYSIKLSFDFFVVVVLNIKCQFVVFQIYIYFRATLSTPEICIPHTCRHGCLGKGDINMEKIIAYFIGSLKCADRDRRYPG